MATSLQELAEQPFSEVGDIIQNLSVTIHIE
jgi:hypothetical protein